MAQIPEHEAIDAVLRSLGATEEQLDAVRGQSHYVGLAADLVLTEGAVLTALDLADRSGVPVEEVLSLWRTLGVDVPDEHRAMFSERDAEFTAYMIDFKPVGSHGAELMRVLGTSLTRVAEAAVAVYVQTLEPKMDRADVEIAVWAQEMADVTASALKLGDSMGAIFSHHMRDAVLRQRIAQAGVHDRSLYRLAVGFVDLVGFTPLSLRTSPQKLLELISQFETKAFEVAGRHNGRIVKHIGDEVMFVAIDPVDGCELALALMAEFTNEGIQPRGGLAYGDVVARQGDYYGEVVNLASRLADLAIPGEVLADDHVRRAAERDSLVFEGAGRRQLKGFDQPVAVYSVFRTEGARSPSG
jgi:adenylate cyclase